MTPTDQSNTDSNAYTQGVQDALFDPSKHSEIEIAERNARVAAATKTNVQKMQIANSNAKAGSEEKIEDALADIFADAADKIAPKQPRGSIERKIALGMMAETLIPLIKLIQSVRDQSSAQAEMRGRVDELEMLRLLCYSGDLTPPKLYSVGKDGMHMTVYDRIKYLKDQLRAQGGENK